MGADMCKVRAYATPSANRHTCGLRQPILKRSILSPAASRRQDLERSTIDIVAYSDHVHIV